MADYNGLTRNAWPGTWSPSSNHPIVLDTEMRGGLRYVSGDSGDRVSDIAGQRLQDGMLIYVKKAHEGFEAEQYYSYKLQAGQYRDSSTGELPNNSNNWGDFRPKVDSASTTSLIDSAYIQARQLDSAQNATNAYRLNGQDGNFYREWSNTLNPPPILDTVDVSNIITTDVDKAFVDALNVDADTLDGYHASEIIALIDSAQTTAENAASDALDSAETIALIDSAYVRARQITYNTDNFTDSAWVSARIDSAINSLIDGAPGALDTLNELAAALNDDSDAYNTLLSQIAALPDSAEVQLITETQVDSDYVQARQDYAYASLTGAPTNLSDFTNDIQDDMLDSTEVITLIDSDYIETRVKRLIGDITVRGDLVPETNGQYSLGTIDNRWADLFVGGNSIYLGRIVLTESDGRLVVRDSNNDLQIEYDFAENTTDDLSEGSTNLYYTDARVRAAVSATTGAAGYNSATGEFSVPETTDHVTEGGNLYYTKSRVDSDIAASFTDSTSSVNVTINNYVEDKVDSAYVLDRVNEAPFLDSVDAIALIDSAYIRARSSNQTLDTTSEVDFATVDAPIVFTAKNVQGSTITKGQVVYVNGVSGEVPTVRLANAGSSATMPAFGLAYANANNNAEVHVVTFGNLLGVNTSAFSVGDTLYVDTTNGALTNVKPAGESNLIQNIGKVVRSHASAGVIRVGGAGRTAATPNLDNDQFFLGNDSNYAVATDFTAAVTNIVDSNFVKNRVATDQDLRTTDSVTFSGLTVSGDLTVTGGTYSVETISYTVNDPLLHLADSNELSDVVDIGFIGHYNRDGNPRHTGFFRDASNEQYYIFNGLIDSAFDSSLPTNIVNRSGTGFTLADLNVGTLHGIYAGFDSDFGNKSTDDLTEGNNHLYYTQTRVNSDIDTRVDNAYVQARQDYSWNSLTDIPDLFDSNDATTLVDATYIQARQDYAYTSLTGAPTNVSAFTNDANYLDSTTAQTLIDASYIQSNQSNIDSDLVIQLIDSGYVQLRQDNLVDEASPTLGADLNVNGRWIKNNSGNVNISASSYIHLNGGGNHRVGMYDTYFFPNYRPTRGQFLTAGSTLARELEWDSVSYLDSGAVQNLIDATYIQANQSNIDSALTQGIIESNFSAINQHLIPNGNAIYDLGDSNNYWRDLYLSGNTLVLGDLKLQQHTGRFRFINRHSGDEVKLVANNVNEHLIDSSVITTLASALPVSTFTNDANYLDSYSVKSVIDSTYIATAIQTDSNITVTITNNIQSEVDSAYVLSRVADAPFLDSYYGRPFVIDIINSEGLDSDLVIALVDSAYIQLRDRFQDSSLVTSTVDAAYVQARVPESYLSTIIDSAYVQNRVTAGTDSAATIQLINNTVDKAYVEALGIDAGLDSALITQLIDSAYVEARVAAVAGADSAEQATNAYRFNNQAPSYYLNYNNLTNKPGIPTVDKATIDALNIDADTLDGQQGTYYLNYNNLSNRPTVLSSTDVKNIFNANGDDEISTGAVVDAKYIEFKHDGGTQHEFIVEVVTKTSDHRYDGSGSNSGYQIDGTESPFIQLVPGNTYRFLQNNPTNVGHPLRFYYDAGQTSSYTSGVTTNGTPGSSGAYTQIVVSESTPSVLYYMCQNHAYMGNAVFTQTRNLTGFTTDDVTEGSTNLYFTNQRVRDVIDSAYIIARQITGLDSALADGFLMTQAEVLTLIDSDYIQLRQSSVGAGGLDSALVTQLIDSAYVQLRQEAAADAGTDSATVIELIQSTVDSAYVAAREALTGSGASVAFKNVAVNTQDTIVAGSAIDTLTFEAGNNITIATDANTNTVTINSTATAVSGGGGGGGTSTGAVTITKYAYTADSDQTVFADSDDTGDALSYDPNDTQVNVYLNGILLVDSDDFTLTDSSTITLTSAAALGDTLQVLKYTPVASGGSGGSTSGVDSAATLSLIDSAYIQQRVGPIASGTLEVNKFYYYAVANQSAFTGADIFGNTLSVDTDAIEVYLNGILLVDSQDYSATSSTITLTDVADSGWSLSVIETIGRVNTHQAMVETVYEFDADSGQTVFTGADRGGLKTLNMSNGIVSVFVNGILVSDLNDYTYTGDTLTLLDAADSGDFISVKVTKGTVASSLNTKQYTFTNIFGSTLTGGGLGFTGNIQVFKNGSPLKESEFAVTNGDTVTLATPAVSSDEFIIQTFNAQDWTAKTYDFIADSAQTVFTGDDRHGNKLYYKQDGLIVYLNGIALVDSADYVATNEHSITFNEPVALNDEVKIYTFIPADLTAIAAPLEFYQYEYTSGNGQTTFTGADDNGNTLSYDSDAVSVYVNGLLLRKEDYTSTSGTDIVLALGASSGDNITITKLTGNNIGLTQSEVNAIVDGKVGNGNKTTWTEVTTNTTVDANTKNIIDCSAGPVNVTLPPTPSLGDEVRIIDGTGNASTNNINILRNGNNIQGVTDNLTIDVDRAGIGLVFYNATQGWILIEN